MESLRQLYRIGHGPSSSHTIGPENACLYVLRYYKNINKVKVTLQGSLALTGKGHLTDTVIKKTLSPVSCEIVFDYKTIPNHPNTMIFDLYDKEEKLIKSITFISVGGGKIIIDGRKNQIKHKNVYPFSSFKEIKEYCLNNNIDLAGFVYKFEDKNIKKYLNKVYITMKKSICNGLQKEGELPGNLHVVRKAKQLFNSPKSKRNMVENELRIVSSYAFAVSEENASGGLIVTAPTCGASGVLPATLFYLKEKMHLKKEKIIDALAVAGIIGNVIKENASISGAFAGCQSEIGSACSMSAGAVSYLNKQDIDVVEYAAEIALEHHLGLTCDPINGLVQIPCIERNAVASIRAIDAASLAKFLNKTRKVSFDTVIKTMYETGKDLNNNYKETSKGGLAKNSRPNK